MLRTLAQHLAARGHKVTVLTGYPPDAGRDLPARGFVGGVRVIRVRSPHNSGGMARRAASGTVFLAQAFAYAARHRFDLVWANSLPPVVNGLVGLLCARGSGARFLYHVHSVHPEAAVAIGALRAGMFSRMLAAINSFTCRAADAVVVLSDDMVRTIADRGGNGAVAFHVLNNFVLAGLGDDRPPPERAGEAFRLVYWGNLGRTQDLRRLVEAMALISPDEGIELELIGTGAAEARLRRLVGKRNLRHVRFTAAEPSQESFRLVRSCNVGVIPLAPNIHRVGFPSKLMTYLAAGLPVLAIVERDSALASYIEKAEAGLVVDGEPEAIAAAIRTARDTLSFRPMARMRFMRMADRDFGRAAACARWAELVESLGAE